MGKIKHCVLRIVTSGKHERGHQQSRYQRSENEGSGSIHFEVKEIKTARSAH